ncbi:MAG: hypothetical protein J6K52_01695 [Clostridia bacterium]|nr:hypothetical protein [Clostridia bacterium]MBQ7788709.1 hypothetical protein [Clostridia bacterium]
MEQIYTIPVNEAFENGMKNDVCECPLCKIYERLENKEVDYVLGPSMMEPSTRMETNEKGFCHDHFYMLLNKNNRLSLALILESHLDTVKEKLKGNFLDAIFGGKAKKTVKATDGILNTCFICEKIDFHFQRMIETVAYLYATESAFREKLKAQKFFCLPHYKEIIEYAKNKLDKKRFADFYKDISEVENSYLDKIKSDVSWFAKKFDYRYDSEPWYDAKDAPERAVKLLVGKE